MTNTEKDNNFNTSIDVLAELEDGSQVIIEIQIIKQGSFINRLWVYICKQVADNFEKLKIDYGKTHGLYKYIKPVYAIAILEHNYFNDNEPFHTFSVQEDTTKNELTMKLDNSSYKNPLKLAFLELKKYEPTKINNNYKKKWFEFFSNIEFSAEPDNIIQQLENILDIKNWTKEEQAMYEEKIRNEDMRIAEIEYALESGIEKGIVNERKNNILSLLNANFSPEKISTLLSIPLDEVVNITKNK